jgi:dCMP deaminase
MNHISLKSTINWDEYFILQAMMASFKSKDPNTKVGCVFVDDHNHQLSMGYNGFVAGVNEKILTWQNNKDAPLDQQKYAYVVHSEANAIVHANCSLEGSRLYVTLFPCHECAKLIATSKVKEVIYLSDKYNGSVENTIAKKIFELSNIQFRSVQIKKEIIDNLSEYFQNLI